MSELRKVIETVLFGSRVELAIYHDPIGTKIQNPGVRPPILLVSDVLTGGLIRESITAMVPDSFLRRKPEDLSEMYLDLLRAYVARLQAQNGFLPSPFPLIWDGTSTFSTQEATPSILALLENAGRTLLPRALDLESIAVSVQLPIQNVAETLQLLVAQNQVEQVEEGHQLLGTTAPSPWTVGTASAVSQEIGLPVRMLRVMLGGPGDVKNEVERARTVLEAWNIKHAEYERVVLAYKHWSLHTYSNLDGRPQGSINHQLVDQADLLVAVFWNRLGTETGQDPSGTAEEIRQFKESGRPAMLFFANRAVSQELLANQDALKQYQALQTYKKDIERTDAGLYWTHDSVDAFADQLDRQLTLKVRDLKNQEFKYAAKGIQGQQVRLHKLQEDLKTFKRAFEEQAGSWKMERTSSRAQRKEAKFVLRKYIALVNSHRSQLIDEMSEQAAAAWTNFLARAKALECLDDTCDHDGFWEGGDDLFMSTRTWLTHLQTTL